MYHFMMDKVEECQQFDDFNRNSNFFWYVVVIVAFSVLLVEAVHTRVVK